MDKYVLFDDNFDFCHGFDRLEDAKEYCRTALASSPDLGPLYIYVRIATAAAITAVEFSDE